MPHDILKSAFRRAVGPLACIGLAACASPPPPGTPAASLPYRIYDTAAERYIDVDALVEKVAPADVVFFGEYHDDAAAHGLQLELLDRLGAERSEIILAMEMFERDVQPVLDAYVGGGLGEDDFLARSRPWNNYAGDYRPLVELAKSRGWRVVGTNLPQPLASAIARGGLPALEGLGAVDRSGAASENQCGDGPYWERFIEAITEESDTTGHQGISAADPMLRTMFEAQCARDEAMAETIASILDEADLIYHVNGAFHSDYRLGIISRLLRRRPQVETKVISTVQVEDLARPDLAEHVGRGDFLVITREPER